MDPVDEAIHHVQEQAIVVKYNQLLDLIQGIKYLSLFKICLVTRNKNIIIELFFQFLQLSLYPFKS